MHPTAAPQLHDASEALGPRPLTGEEFEALWDAHWIEWALEDLTRVDPRANAPARRTPKVPRERPEPESIAKQPQAPAAPTRRLTYEERLARMEALVGPMRAMPMPRVFLMTEHTAPVGYAAHLMRVWGDR